MGCFVCLAINYNILLFKFILITGFLFAIVQCAVSKRSLLKQPVFWGVQYSRGGPQAPDIWATPPHIEWLANAGFSLQMPLSQGLFLQSPGWLTNCCFESSLRAFQVKPAPLVEGKERPEEEVSHSTLVGGRLNKQGHLHTRLASSGHKTSNLCIHLPESYIEALMGFS